MKKRIALALCLVMVLSLLAGCSKEIAVTADLTQITFSGAAAGTAKQDYTATLTPAEHYELPETITVEVDAAVLDAGSYTYDPETGALTIPAEAVTGDVVITAVAKESLVGAWTGTVDITDMMNETLTSADPAMMDYFSMTGLSFDLDMTFTKDGLCTMSVNDASVEVLVDTLKVQMEAGIVRLFEDAIAAEGLDMTVEELLAYQGYTIESFMEEYFPAEELVSTMTAVDESGKYLAEDGMLYISGSVTEEVDVTALDPNPYTLHNGVLTLEANSEADETVAFMFPLVLERVS